jgi:hypothetical protein
MRGVEHELALLRSGDAGVAGGRASGWWAFAVAMAATMLFWLHMSLSATHATSYSMHLPDRPPSVDATARQIQELLPELSRRDAWRHAVVLRAGENLLRSVDVTTDSGTHLRWNNLDDLSPPGE